jgi:signal transduction histidine kinase
MIAERVIAPDILVIKVKDTGVGIEEENLEALFNPFSKIKNEFRSDMNKMGVGLGLNISMNLSRALGGDISVQSTLGKGTVFTITIK